MPINCHSDIVIVLIKRALASFKHLLGKTPSKVFAAQNLALSWTTVLYCVLGQRSVLFFTYDFQEISLCSSSLDMLK